MLKIENVLELLRLLDQFFDRALCLQPRAMTNTSRCRID